MSMNTLQLFADMKEEILNTMVARKRKDALRKEESFLRMLAQREKASEITCLSFLFLLARAQEPISFSFL